MKNLIKTLGSLSFALILIGSLAAVLIVSTLLESAYGTPFAQKLFYQNVVFDVFLGLLGVNILFSALSRWPYKLHHTGFLITHAGILMLLTGSLLSRLFGVDGQMALMEGEKKDKALLQEYQLAVHEPEGKVHVWDLRSFSRTASKTLPLSDPSRRLTLEKIEDGVLFIPEVRSSGDASVKNRAVRFTLSSERAGFSDSFWLVEHSDEAQFSRRLSIGMADVELRDKPLSASDTPRLLLIEKKTGKTAAVPLTPGAVSDAALKDLNLRVTKIVYFPDARVGEDNKLMNASDVPRNPAVRFTLEDADGHREERMLFKLFPDFESIHGRKTAVFEEIRAELSAPESELAQQLQKPGIVFYLPGDRWTYEARSSKGKLTGDVKVGEKQPTGWMDFAFQVDEVLDDAVVEKKMKAGGSKKGDVGVLLSLSADGKSLGSRWAVPGEPVMFETVDGPVTTALGVKSVDLPFKLKLLDFRKQDYPGTQSAASYESDVMLEDTAEGVTIQKKIWMNHPLDYKGYRIFQSSFSQDPEAGEMSVFSIAKNPGIGLIYGGSIVMFIGVVCVFYVKPFSYLSARRGHAGTKK